MNWQAAGLSLPGSKLPAQTNSYLAFSPKEGETALVLCEGHFYFEALQAIVGSLYQIDGPPAQRVADSLRQADRAVNAAFGAYSEEDKDELGWVLLGAAVAVLLDNTGLMTCGWVGAGRILQLRDSRIVWENREHTLERWFHNDGKEVPAGYSENAKFILTRSFTCQKPVVEPELDEGLRVQPGDTILLCNEWVGRVMATHELAALATGEQPVRIANHIAQAAIDRDSVGPATVLVALAR